MKALLFERTGGFDELKVAEIPKPSKLSANQVRCKLLAAGLNHLDLWVLKGLPRVKYQFPHIAGADFCGEVLESNSQNFLPGDRVVLYPAESSGLDEHGRRTAENLCADFRIRGENTAGVFAEEIIVEDKYVFKAPPNLDDAQCASFPLVYLTAWQMITEKAGLSENLGFSEPILVHGAGSGVTHAILEILINFGATRIAVTSRDENKLGRWAARGIQSFKTQEDMEAKIKDWAGGRVSLIFDHVGESLFEMNIRLLKTGGKLITCGATSGPIGKLDLRHLYFRQLQLLGSTMGSLQHFHQLLEWFRSRKVSLHVGHRYSLTDARQGYELMNRGQQDGKIVFLP